MVNAFTKLSNVMEHASMIMKNVEAHVLLQIVVTPEAVEINVLTTATNATENAEKDTMLVETIAVFQIHLLNITLHVEEVACIRVTGQPITTDHVETLACIGQLKSEYKIH